jgi:hypothetical protein
MNNQIKKYDVAFSFTHKDEILAGQLYELLRNRMSCFIYFEEQKRLAGEDGERIFNSVFSQESRIVVILYNNDWGKTKWTRIEQTAIKNKGFDEGYDFAIIIPTQKNVEFPEWLPKNKICIDIDRWGIESAASVIETRVQQFGGEIKIESVADIAARAEKSLVEKKIRKQLLDSPEGLKLAFNEVQEIISEVHRHETQIKSQTDSWHFLVRNNNRNGVEIISFGFHLTFQFYQKYANTSDDAYLLITLYNGSFDENGYPKDPFSKNELISEARLKFSINEFDQRGWIDIETNENFVATSILVEQWIKELIYNVTRERQDQGY